MANNIALAQKYLPILDEVYKWSARTSILDAADVKFINANTVQLFKMSMDGLGTYNRSTGFVTGDVKGEWDSYALTQDRGRAFIIDSMDNEETIGMAFGKLAGEFIRTKVAPEIDAYTFATLAGTANILSANADLAVGTTDVAALIENATEALDAEEVPDTGRVIFMSEKCYNAMKQKIDRQLSTESGVSTDVETFNGMRIVRVPQARFNTKITLYNGTDEGQTTGGFVVPTDETAYKINFMIVHPSAVIKVAKHVLPRIFSPQQYQQADAWKFDYRIYHDVFVEENKVKGIYLHRTSTAITV